MGIPYPSSGVTTRDRIISTMKTFILLCVGAAAMAEADSYNHFYSGTYSPYAYNTYSHFNTYPYTYHYGKREAEADSQFIYSGLHYPKVYSGLYNTYSHYNTYPYAHHYGKREAEADSQFFYSGMHYPKVYSGLYNTYSHYNTYPYAHHYGKREAEADSQFFYSGMHY